jgi:hypothetical protein
MKFLHAEIERERQGEGEGDREEGREGERSGASD